MCVDGVSAGGRVAQTCAPGHTCMHMPMTLYGIDMDSPAIGMKL